jgi:hypothetical protein
MTDDVRKLLGGYATGTLTEEEKELLFQAALHDDALFAALADEHALKDLLDDGAVRAQVLQATEDPRFSVWGALREWFEHPKSKALVATAAVLLAIIGFNQVRMGRTPETTSIAELRAPAAPQTRPTAPEAKKSQPETTGRLAPFRARPPQESLRDAQSASADKAKSTTANSIRQSSEAPPASPLQAAAPPPPAPPAASPVAGAAAARDEKTIVAAESGGVAGGAVGAVGGSFSPRAALRSTGAAPGAFQKAAGTSITPLRYELLRRNTAGEFQAVPANYLFVPGDVVRLRVTSARDGAVGVSSNAGAATASRTLAANTWTEVPDSGGIAITADTTRLVVAFAPSEAPASTLLETDEARAKRTSAPAVSLEILIRQKKP